jgi:hypothetical protein
MSRFKKGDKVVRNNKVRLSGDYGFTNKRAGIMEVVDVKAEGKVIVLTIHNCGTLYDVESKYFDLCKSTISEKDMTTAKKFIAIQKGCDNVIENEEGEEIISGISNVKAAVDFAIKHEENGYDIDEGEVVIYELVPVMKAKSPKTEVRFENI